MRSVSESVSDVKARLINSQAQSRSAPNGAEVADKGQTRDLVAELVQGVKLKLARAESARAAERAQLDALHASVANVIIPRMDAILAGLETEARAREQNGPSALPEIPGLFIFGHARSGTSILLRALNSSPDIFLFGEANFHLRFKAPGFRSWYHAMHFDLNKNPRMKGIFCPNLLPENASGEQYLQRLCANYKLVGDKVAFAGEIHEAFDETLEFYSRFFFDAKYVCVVRHPLATLTSAGLLFGRKPVTFANSYARNLLHIVDMHQIFPHCRILIHEDVGPDKFAKLSHFLGVDLPSAASLYCRDPVGRVSDWRDAGIEQPERAILERAWTTFLSFYDPEKLTLRDAEDRLQRWQRELKADIDALSGASPEAGLDAVQS